MMVCKSNYFLRKVLVYEQSSETLSSATLVLPLNVTTPRDSFWVFYWSYTELANSLLTLCDRSEGSLSLGVFEQGSRDQTTQSFLPHIKLLGNI